MESTKTENDVDSSTFTHERVLVHRGSRSGLPIVVAVHSTALGQAIGGCRLTAYPDWRAGLTDALRLSTAMSDKCALAGLPHGGGKTVVALPPDTTLDDAAHRAVLHDVGDVIAAQDGAYATGPDVGTGPDDMAVIAERTSHVFCRPPATRSGDRSGTGGGGSGDSSVHTASGVMAALGALCAAQFGSDRLAGRRFAVLGLGRVGSHIAAALAEAGAQLVVADIDGDKRARADGWKARWVSPQDCLEADVDVLVPAALGGLLTPESVPRLRCAAIAGPANNQLDAPDTAELLHRRGILWAPDVIVSAGGVIHATGVELRRETAAQVHSRVVGIADTLTAVLRAANRSGTTPAAAARRLARQRIAAARPAATP